MALLLVTAATARAENLSESAGLDGVHLALGPTGGAVYTGGAWDGAFGAGITLVRVREAAPLGVLGLELGGARMSRADRSRLWADLLLGTFCPLGLAAGLSVGALMEIDPVISPSWGAQASIWLFAGVVPFVRIGVAERGGTYLDLGLKMALPVLRM